MYGYTLDTRYQTRLTDAEYARLVETADTLWQMYYRLATEESGVLSGDGSTAITDSLYTVLRMLTGAGHAMIEEIMTYMSDNGVDGRIARAIEWVAWDDAMSAHYALSEQGTPDTWPGREFEYRTLTEREARVAQESDWMLVRRRSDGAKMDVRDVQGDAMLVRHPGSDRLYIYDRSELCPTQDVMDGVTREIIAEQKAARLAS